MKVSVLIATYNRLSQLTQAIDSVLAQTLPADEILILDDGSTDGTSSAIQYRYGARVRVVRQNNTGVGRARQRAVEEARGEWIAFLDSDDLWHPTKLERQFQALGALGSEFGLCFTNCTYTGNPSLRRSSFEEAGLESSSQFGPLEDSENYVLGRHPLIYIVSWLVRRSLLIESGGFDGVMKVAEDVDMLFRLMLKTKFCFVSERLVKIDRTPSRAVALSYPENPMDDRKFACEQHMHKKWLSLPELKDPGTREKVQCLLRGSYYDWAIHKLTRLQIGASLRNIQAIRALGDSYGTILSTLVGRAWRKVNREFRGR